VLLVGWQSAGMGVVALVDRRRARRRQPLDGEARGGKLMAVVRPLPCDFAASYGRMSVGEPGHPHGLKLVVAVLISGAAGRLRGELWTNVGRASALRRHEVEARVALLVQGRGDLRLHGELWTNVGRRACASASVESRC
jgi:hypothetical protein